MPTLGSRSQSKVRPVMLLRIMVHAEAFLSQPRLYASCLWWRLVGKRLRSRMRLAHLLGETAHAYDLWQALTGPEQGRSGTEPPAAVVGLVKHGAGAETTLSSLADAGIDGTILDGNWQDVLASLRQDHGEGWLLILQPGDCVSKAAGVAYRLAISQAPADTHLIYADDDLVDAKGRRHSPHFKPDWNSELFQHFDFVSGSAIIKLSAFELGSSELTFDEAVQRTVRKGGQIVHLPKVLHHRQSRPAPTLPLPPLAPRSASGLPSISVLVPTRNRLDLLEKCLEGLKTTEYPGQIEIIVIDNDSDDPATIDFLANIDPNFARVMPFAGVFNFAAMNNCAARQANGDLLCFLNNDIEITDPKWLAIMAQQAEREEVGAVGAQLLYPNGRVQHAGVVLGISGAAAHAHRLLQPTQEGYFHRHNLPQFVSAVTAACLVVNRTKFDAVGGFDEERFAVSFNDVDLCLNLRAKGWQSLYEPRARLVHHESISRGLDRDSVGAARQAREVANLQEKWRTQLACGGEKDDAHSPDPYHHPELSPLSEQFVVRL